MNRKQRPATWPFVLALVVLFFVSVAEPRTWQRRPLVERHGIAARATALATAETDRNIAEKALSRPDWSANIPKGVLSSVHAGDALAAAPRSQEPAPPPVPLSVAASDLNFVDRDTAADRANKPQAPAAAEVQQQNNLASSETAPAALPKTAALQRPAAKRAAYHRSRRIVKAADHPPHRTWEEPSVLLDQLDRLSAECDSGLWAARVADVVRDLCRVDHLQSPRTALALKRLRDLVDANHPLLALPIDSSHAGEQRRLRYAVLRRLDLWELVPELADRRGPAAGRNQTVSLPNVASRLPDPAAGVARLLSDLERFEQTGLTDDGRDVAADVSRLAAHDEKLTARTHRWLEWNYRNSNMRLVLSQELLNRLVPVQPAVEEPVHDRILGVPTRGWSTSTARLSIQLIPDPRQIRFALEARGIVVARTASRRDPVTVYSNSDSAFLARKQLQLSAAGLQAWPTEAEVTNNSRLRGIETDYDDVPLLGPLVEGIARAKHAESEPAVRRVARRKVAARVQEEVDAAIEPKLAQARRLYRERVVSPLEGLTLEPAVIEMQTTEERLTARLRLAGDEQLAASTPRPMALSDSLASVQIHQSLANNICDRLDLDGRTFTLPELQRRLVKAFKLRPESLAEEYPADLRVTFAKRDSVIARFDEGRVELNLGVAELHKYPEIWRDFQVRVFYRPRIQGLDVRFARDGTVQLRGEHFGREPQIALRGIFSKVFSHDRELVFIDASLLADPRVAGLQVTQCVLTDGWIGLSLGVVSSRQAQRGVGPLH